MSSLPLSALGCTALLLQSSWATSWGDCGTLAQIADSRPSRSSFAPSAIASWFRTNSAQDSTNGASWCYRPYSDDMPLFAPSLKTMLASAGGDPIAAGKKVSLGRSHSRLLQQLTLLFTSHSSSQSHSTTQHQFCGLEAIVSTPDGRSATMFIGDAFDDRWVLTPTSIDVAYGAFHLLFGSTTDNKNDVIQGVTWELTGNRRSE